MYSQTITSHCSPPFPGYCWTKKNPNMNYYRTLLMTSLHTFPFCLFTNYSYMQGHSFLSLLFWNYNASIINYAKAKRKNLQNRLCPQTSYLLIWSVLISETLNFSKRLRNAKYLISSNEVEGTDKVYQNLVDQFRWVSIHPSLLPCRSFHHSFHPQKLGLTSLKSSS